MLRPTPPEPVFHALWRNELDQVPPSPPWLWAGYLAPSQVTLLSSRPKAGKTTLITALLGGMEKGGTLAGQEVRPGKAVVVSEESPSLWNDRAARFALGPHVAFLCRPFAAKPTLAQWQALLDHVAGMHAACGLSLAVIDTLTEFLPPYSENDPTRLVDAFLPLRRLTAVGLAVLLTHHVRKLRGIKGHQARGSVALVSQADIVMELDHVRSPTAGDRRRKLLALSRFPATPHRTVIRLNDAGNNFDCLGNPAELALAHLGDQIRAVLADADQKLTQEAIRQGWPADRGPCPSLAWLSRWLNRAVTSGEVLRDGAGVRSDPYRYWLKGQDEKWKNPLWKVDKENEKLNRFFRELG